MMVCKINNSVWFVRQFLYDQHACIGTVIIIFFCQVYLKKNDYLKKNTKLDIQFFMNFD